jgi:large-conductance mechanosensitive channel
MRPGDARSLDKLLKILYFLLAYTLTVPGRQGINRMKRKAEAEVEAAPAPELPADVKLLAEIRDILKTRTAAG